MAPADQSSPLRTASIWPSDRARLPPLRRRGLSASARLS
jgi:hypothetical protein